MEFVELANPNPRNNTKLFTILGILVLLSILLFAGFKLFSTGSLPQEFIDAYKWQDGVATTIQNNSSFDFNTIGQESSMQTAYQAVSVGLDKNTASQQQYEDLLAKTIALKRISLPNTSVYGQDILKLYQLLDTRNTDIKKLLLAQASIFSTLKKHYEILSAGGQDQNQNLQNINQLIATIQAVSNDILSVDQSIDSTYQTILKEAGITDTSATSGLKLNFKEVPTEVPIKQYVLPTLVPTPTIASPSATPVVLTATPVASSSAH